MKQKQFLSILKERWIFNDRGSSLVEVLLAAGLLGILVIALTGILIYGQESIALAGRRSRAVFLAEEGLEATRAIRNSNYSDLSNGNHGLVVSSGQWIFSGTSDTTGEFTRQITITTPSSNHKQIISTVTWQQTTQRPGSVILTTELTNWR